MEAYAAYKDPKTRKLIPVAVLTYLASEAVSRTVASAASASILRKMQVRDIETKGYVYGEYLILSLFTGVMAGVVICEAMVHQGFRPAKTALAFAIGTTISGTLSGIISVLTIDLDDQQKVVAIAGAGAVAVVGVVFASLDLAVAGAGAFTGAKSLVLTGSLALAGAGAGAGVGAGALTGALDPYRSLGWSLGWSRSRSLAYVGQFKNSFNQSSYCPFGSCVHLRCCQ